ncbi:MAG: fructose-6-phosphate aldolase [Tepidanaerobacter acetatoxydans]|uniref:transaldolase family protein n=1 Tax=Tepidanaerobacter acetatoxydans TaxID=499229 RepID=UPI0026F1EC54|nr:transaldolase family protein [Tepidanaerobacter acetatoxydans]NLU10779.1 fructose-6-phosphate aldolase [Tepidanaerobacter acetatoxydans]
MLYLLDTANVKDIRRICDVYPIDGVTTNPTLISKEKTDFKELLMKIKDVLGLGKMIHVQTLGENSEDIVNEGEALNRFLGENAYAKIPVTPQGIKAIQILSQKGIKTTATAVFTPQQALIAARAGADFVAPYVNRLDNIVGDGVEIVSEIVREFKIYNLKTKVVAASFKNLEQIHKASQAGTHAVTVAPELFEKLLQHPLTDSSIKKFEEDWETIYGKDKLISDLI